MDIKTHNETYEGQNYPSGFCSSISDSFVIGHKRPDEERPDIMQLDRNDRLKLAIGELRIGARIHAELKRQGRTVSWLAQQLCMERTSLYYTFHQNSIDLELLLRISFFLGHDFLQDVIDAYKSCGL